MNLGENIYRLRTEKNMSQGDLADALEVSRQSVSKWENNSAVPELDKLVKIAQLFGVTLDELASNIPVQPPKPDDPPMEVPARQSISVRNIVGIMLLCCSVLSAVLFLIFSAPIWILLVSAPLCLFSLICLLPSRHFWRNTLIILGCTLAVVFLFCSVYFRITMVVVPEGVTDTSVDISEYVTQFD